ncbi:MAG TPA: anti-sigma factor, partial [Rubrobacter sp.]|nr:anti-sigma factor [Rubrobacter sp.]
MNYQERHPDLTAFVLRELDPEASEEIRRHLASCPRCRDELEGLQKVNRALEAAPPPVDPPDYLKDEILTRLRAEKESRSEPELPASSERRMKSPKAPRFHLLSSVAVAAAVTVVVFGIFFGLPRAEAPVATVALVPTPEEAAGLDGYWGVAEIRPQPSDNQQVELRLNNFDEPEPDKYYELWFASGDRRISAGSFTSVGR